VAYGIPWQRQARNSNSDIKVPLTLLHGFVFRNVAVRP
jgi:hypothetical protein